MNIVTEERLALVGVMGATCRTEQDLSSCPWGPGLSTQPACGQSMTEWGQEDTMMRVTIGLIMVVMGLTMGMIRHRMKLRAWGKSVAQASKAGRLGKMSLKSTLSVLSMAGAMVLFSSIDSALAPDDLLGRQWLASEKAEYLAEMAKREPSWYSHSWTISGSIICFTIMFVGGSLGICWGRGKRRRGGDKERR